MPKKSPPEHFRESLAGSRRAGDDFEAAWEAAWASARWCRLGGSSEERNEWKAAIASMREVWQSAYDRLPDPRCEAVEILRESLTEVRAPC